MIRKDFNQLDYEEEEDTLKDRFMSFKVANIDYALELGYITEIISVQKITEVPNIKPFIIGIINLRGAIIPIISIRIRFGLDVVENNDKTCIIVISHENHTVGLLVDEVSEVLSIRSNDKEDAPTTNKGYQSKFIESIGKINGIVVTILDIKNLIFDDEQIN